MTLPKIRAERNRTTTVSPEEASDLLTQIGRIDNPVSLADVKDRVLWGDAFYVASWLPAQIADLLILDPPYNLDKTFGETAFKSRSMHSYAQWLDAWLPDMLRLVKPNGTVYLCGDWRSSPALHQVAEKYLVVRNRITWEREKGRGAQNNWKNASEDIYFCTIGETYSFNVEAVKLKRRVLAPYRDATGKPKDWDVAEGGDKGGFRLTHPSDLWTDITVPFWSMPENTDHPTQKPEKLIAKLILASSNVGDLVLDPFLGSGTTAVVAQKLGRHFIGIEREKEFCCLAQKRLLAALSNAQIQGYSDGVFWERNTAPASIPASPCSSTLRLPRKLDKALPGLLKDDL